MITVEESSTMAVSSWPLLAERLPGVFLDAGSSAITVGRKPGLTGVSLGIFYSATSQGAEFFESMTFSRTGRATVRLTAPLSMVTEDLGGRQVETVDNLARIIAGDLRVEGTSSDGTVRLQYEGCRFTLRPGEVWAEMLVLRPDGVKRIDALNWADEFPDSIEQGYPVTRLAIANRGLWPKANVKAGSCP